MSNRFEAVWSFGDLNDTLSQVSLSKALYYVLSMVLFFRHRMDQNNTCGTLTLQVVDWNFQGCKAPEDISRPRTHRLQRVALDLAIYQEQR